MNGELLKDIQSEVYKTYEKGRKDERKKIMNIVDSADDMAQAIYLLGQYIIIEELKDYNRNKDK